MKTKIILLILSFFTATFLLSACGHNDSNSDKIYRVGIASMNFNDTGVVKGLKKGMEARGYVENENIKYIYQGPSRDKDKLKQLINKFIVDEVDLIYTITTPATKIAAKLTKGSDIPLLFGPIMSAVESGLVSSLYSPDNRMTGVQVRGATEKALFYLKEIVPELKNIYVPVHAGSIPSEISFKDLKVAAEKISVNVIRANVVSTKDLIDKLSQIPATVEAIWIAPSILIIKNIDNIVEAASKLKIPVAAPAGLVNNGPVVTYSPKHIKIGTQISRLADKLLKGINPASLPVETAEFYLGVNLKTAKGLGLVIPAHLLNAADTIVR